ncbi:cilia- and flagella-associated protein 74 [Biomphalaria glabrata]|nr:cilia- and flagella-associated protein 74 [Biomphalaria glabrata]
MLMGYISDEDIKESNIMNYEGSNLDLTSSSDEDEETLLLDDQSYPETKQEKISWQEQIRMMQLRSHINQLLDEVKQAQYIADKTREELKKCKMQIKLFEGERDKLFDEIKAKEAENNRSAIDRLCATHERVCKELEAEQKLEAVITEKLDQAEYDLARAELERGKFILAEDDLLQRELKLSQDKAEMAMVRQQKEEIFTKQALTTKQKENKLKKQAMLEADRRHKHAVEEAEKSHERANKYLSKTMAKLKKRQEEEAERYKTDMTRKMEMLLKLREDIANNKENLRAIKAKDQAWENKKKAAEELEREKILVEGGNPDHSLLVKKRKNEMEKMKQQFEADQQLKRVQIVQKIVREEENLKKKKKLQPYLWEWPDREKSLRVPPRKAKIPKMLQDYIAADDEISPSKENVTVQKELTKKILEVQTVRSSSFSDNDPPALEYPSTGLVPKINKNQPLPDIVVVDEPDNNENNLNRSADVEDDLTVVPSFDKPDEDYTFTEEEENEEIWEEQLENISGEEQVEDTHSIVSQEENTVESDSEPEEEPQVDLAKPEFEGLWNKQTKPIKVSKTIEQPAQVGHQGMSKMEEEILKKTLEKTRNGIVTTQIAAGKEFKGPPFYSKPDVIHFKDFEVGKIYKKKIKITNVSYTLNYIKFVDISDKLKDFIKIQFDPPGHMSAGLTCDLLVTFKPMINEDLTGKVNFLTQTGPFEIPLICSTKKCKLSVDSETIDFGTHVIGETLRRTVTLTNNGALGTNFEFFKVSLQPVTLSQDQSKELPVAEIEKKSSEFPQLVSTSETTVAEKVSELSVSVINQPNLISPAQLSAQRLSTSQITVQNPDSMTVSTNNLELSEGKSLTQPVISASGQPQANTVPEETKSADNVVSGNVANENNETNTEANNTKIGTPFKKGLSFQDTAMEVSPEMDELNVFEEMMVGNVSCPELGPFSSVQLEIIWKPKIPGDVKVDFEIKFSDPLSKPLRVVALGSAIDVPVWVERSCVDLQTCILDRLYQDTVIIYNRASTALRLKFEVAPEIKDHMEILPKTGYIQAQSQFSAQLKFLPRKSIYQDAPAFIDKDIGVLEAPVTIRVTDQTTPVTFTVQAVVTNSDIEISESNIDFGFCTIHESVVKRVELTNKSILPQQLGFVSLPEWIEVQPNDGFVTLLPLEKLTVDIIFSPKKAEEFKFQLICRSLINRDFKISCIGVGVHTPLELSKQVIHFGATSLFDKASTYLHVINNHISANEFANPVPRIGKGKICPVGPTSFQFIVPSDAPITISPTVGTVLPGKKCKINVQFKPALSDKEIKEEANNIAEREKEKLKQAESLAKLAVEPTISESKTKLESKRKDKIARARDKTMQDASDSVLKVISNKAANKGKTDKNAQAIEADLQNFEPKLDFFQDIDLSADELIPGNTGSKQTFFIRNETSHLKTFSSNHKQKTIVDQLNVNLNAPFINEGKRGQSLQNLEEKKDSKVDQGAEKESKIDQGPEKESKLEQGAASRDHIEGGTEFEWETENLSAKTPGKSSSNVASQTKLKMSSTSVSVIPESIKEKIEPEEINAKSPEYLAATSALIRQFKGRFQSFTIPCYVASGATSVPGGLDYSVHNTLYLEVHCPAVKPSLVVISDGGKQTLDFGNVSIGQTSQKSITIQNITDKYVELKPSLVNPAGPFQMLNALRPLAPGATHTILMTFAPEKSQIFQEKLFIKSLNSTLHLTLKGYGVSPLVNLSFTESVFDMGAVLSGEYVEKVFTIENTSILCINYIIKQESLSPDRYNAQNLEFLNYQEGAIKNKHCVGTQNYNGKNVFDIVPMRGSIPGGASQEITVTFAPDHESDLYSDGVRVELFDEEGSHFFRLVGQGKTKMMYIEGYDQLLPSQESLALSPYYLEDEEQDGKLNVPASPPALITIKSLMLNDTIQPGSRTLYVGCVRTMAVSQKKNGEFSIEGLQNLIQKGFTVEPQKGMIEAGVKKPVNFTWTPPANHDPNVLVEETATITLKCDGSEQITLMIQAMVVTG